MQSRFTSPLLIILFILASELYAMAAEDNETCSNVQIFHITNGSERPEDDEALIFSVLLGPVDNGEEIVLEDNQGQRLGSISVFGQITPVEQSLHQLVVRLPANKAPGDIYVIAKRFRGGVLQPCSQVRDIRLLQK